MCLDMALNHFVAAILIESITNARSPPVYNKSGLLQSRRSTPRRRISTSSLISGRAHSRSETYKEREDLFEYESKCYTFYGLL
jgi:hypothetical protein